MGGTCLQQLPTAAQKDVLWGFADYSFSAAHHMPQNAFVSQNSELSNKNIVL